jgi:hypothetical protein
LIESEIRTEGDFKSRFRRNNGRQAKSHCGGYCFLLIGVAFDEHANKTGLLCQVAFKTNGERESLEIGRIL